MCLEQCVWWVWVVAPLISYLLIPVFIQTFICTVSVCVSFIKCDDFVNFLLIVLKSSGKEVPGLRDMEIKMFSLEWLEFQKRCFQPLDICLAVYI